MAHDPTDHLNPYAPPAGDAAPLAARPVDGVFAGPLFSVVQIGVATFFGTVLAGSMLLQANYRVMDRPAAANRTVAIGLVLFAGLYAFALEVRDRGVATVVNLVAVAIFCVVTSVLQRDAYGEHVIAGGARRSSWWVVAVIVASLGARSLLALVIRRIALPLMR